MRQPRIFNTESFRLAALFAVLFLGFAGVLLVAVYFIVADVQTTELLATIDADINTIHNGYLKEGVAEAVEVVQQRLGPPEKAPSKPESYLLIETREGVKVAGNLPTLKQKTGLFSLTSPTTILGKGEFLDSDTYLFAGRDTTAIAATRTRLLYVFAWLTAATIVLAVSGGVMFSMQFMRRIDAIARTCDGIVQGQFAERIPVRGSGDELDRLSIAINAMLDRIATLLDNLRQTSSDIAHDLRTPLTHLRQRLEDARSKSTNIADYSIAVSRAIDDTDEILSIFSALLRISQIEAGTRQATFAPFSLSELLNKVYETYLPVAEDHGDGLQRAIAPNVSVHGDPELLLQLFSNLVENSIRHTPSGTSIAIELKLDGAHAVASVGDDGPGIPGAEREKVLRRFYRVAASRSTPGNGLGLALVAAIASLHRAKIELADNHPGVARPGVRASIALPA